jgi:hypothetical protein
MNSIYHLQGTGEYEEGWVTVGWDADRATFCAQVSMEYPDIDGGSYVRDLVRVGAADVAARTVQQAFPPLRHVDPAPAAETAPTAAMPPGLHRQGRTR